MLGGGPGTLTFASALTGNNVIINGNVAIGLTNESMADLTVNGMLDLAGNSITVSGLWGPALCSPAAIAATLSVGVDGEMSEFDGTLQDGSGQLAVSNRRWHGSASAERTFFPAAWASTTTQPCKWTTPRLWGSRPAPGQRRTGPQRPECKRGVAGQYVQRQERPDYQQLDDSLHPHR